MLYFSIYYISAGYFSIKETDTRSEEKRAEQTWEKKYAGIGKRQKMLGDCKWKFVKNKEKDEE